MNVLHIQDPGKNPVRGMRSAALPSSLPPGFFSQLTNLRFNNGRLQVRSGLKKLTPAVPIAGASQRGAFAGFLRGSFVIVGAYRVTISGTPYTLLYSCNPSTFAWTEITSDGTIDAKLGNSRFTSDGKVSFQVVTDQFGKEVLVAQNGADFPRVYDPSAPTHEQVAIHQPLTIPSVAPTVALGFGADYLIGWRQLTGSSYYTGSPSFVITDATFTTPIVIETAAVGPVHSNVATGDQVAIFGVAGNYAANGVWTATAVDADHFKLNKSVGSGAFTGPGGGGYAFPTVFTRFGFATLSTPVPGNNGTLALSIGATATAGDTAAIVTHFAHDLSTVNQLMIAFSSANTGLWDQMTIQASDGVNPPTIIWNPSTSLIDPIYNVSDFYPADPNAVIAAFDLTQFAGSTDPSINSCSELIFIWGGGTPGVASQVLFYYIALSGDVPGQSSYGFTWLNSSSRAESYGSILPVANVSLAKISINQGGTDSFHIPNDPLFNYTALVSLQNVSVAQMNLGVDTFRLYREDYGEVQFTLADSYAINTFTGGTPGSWSRPTGTTVQKHDHTLPSAKDISQIMPDAFHLPCPTGSSMCVNGSRLYVGGVGTAKNQVWISDSTGAFKFRKQVRFLNPQVPDQDSPCVNTFPGETVTSVVQGAGSLIGVSPVFTFTNTTLWRLDGINVQSLAIPTRANFHGSPVPGSIAERYGDIYWVDPEEEVRSLSSGSPVALSYNKVDNKLNTYSLANASAAVMQDRYYLACQAPGDSVNKNLLVYESLMGEWCEDRIASGDAKQLITVDNATGARMIYVFSDAGLIYQLETPGQDDDDGVPIPITITTAELHGDMWQQVSRERFGMVTDRVETSPPVFTITSIWRDPIATPLDGQIDTSKDTRDTAWLWEAADNNGYTVKPGATGLSVQLQITGNCPSLFNFFSLCLEFKTGSKDIAKAGA